jgi:hypothetical protein
MIAPPPKHNCAIVESTADGGVEQVKVLDYASEKYSQALGTLATRLVSLPTTTLWPSIPRATFMWPRPIGAAESNNLSQ